MSRALVSYTRFERPLRPDGAASIAGVCPIALAVGAAGQRIGFATNREDIAAWPLRYLAPLCSFGAADESLRPSVAVVADDALHGELRAALEQAPRGAASSTYEGQPVDRHRLPGGTVALLYRDRPGITLIDDDAEAVAFVTAGADPQAPFEAARMIREVLRRRLEGTGRVVIHAGAVAVGGSVWLVCGPKFSGKTTLVCALIEHLAADFVANDRVFLGSGEAGLEVLSWPMSIRIGIGTCLASPPLRRWLRPGTSPEYPQSGWDPRRGLDRCTAHRLAARRDSPKLELTAAELVASLGGRAVSGGRLAGVLLPVRDPDMSSAAGATSPVAAVDATQRLRRELLTPDDGDYPDWLELRRAQPPSLRAGALDLLRRVVSSYPVLEIRFATGQGAARAVRGLSFTSAGCG
jgi:hypothetical protein